MCKECYRQNQEGLYVCIRCKRAISAVEIAYSLKGVVCKECYQETTKISNQIPLKSKENLGRVV